MTLKSEDLAQFYGTETWWRHPLCPNITYTDGAKYVAEKGGAHWLLDIIATNNAYGEERFKQEEFQSWVLKVDTETKTGALTCDDGNRNVFFTQKLDYTDFPLPEITLFFENNVICLPSER